MNGRYKWVVVGMLWAVCVLNYADRQAFSAVLPSLRNQYGFGPVELGFIGSAFAWIYAFGAPIAGFVGDRISRKSLILGGCIFWSGTTVLTGRCASIAGFTVVRALTGVGECVYFPSALSLMGDYHGKGTRSLAFSLHQSGVYVGSIVGSWLGAWFAERMGWRLGFYVLGGAGVVLALALVRFLIEPQRSAPEEKPAPESAAEASGKLPVGETLRAVFSKPTSVILLCAFFCANFVATIFLTWTPLFLVEKFDMGIAAAGLWAGLLLNAASAVSVPAGGAAADWLARRVRPGRMIVQAVGLVGGAAFVGIFGLTSDRSVLFVALAAVGFFKGLYDSNIFAALYDTVEPRVRASAAGIMNTVGWGGGALGPLAVGIAAKYGRHAGNMGANMGDAIAAGALMYALGAVLLLFAATVTAKRDIGSPAATRGA